MYYKCYYHPKTDGSDHCRGCKLPICTDCQHELGFCPECMRKRDAVDDLRQLRHATASKVRVTSSTTARLRLAIRQVGPIAKRGRLAPGMVDTALLATGQLNADAWQREAMAQDAKVPTHFKEMMAQRKSQWTYDPDRVAYRGVAGGSQPKKAKAGQGHYERSAAAGRVHRPRVEAEGAGTLLGRPFLLGLAVGLCVVLVATFGPGFLKGQKAKAKPIYSNLTQEELTLVREINGTEPALVEARARAAARRALLADAFAEASAVSNDAKAAATFRPPVPAAAPAVTASQPIAVPVTGGSPNRASAKAPASRTAAAPVAPVVIVRTVTIRVPQPVAYHATRTVKWQAPRRSYRAASHRFYVGRRRGLGHVSTGSSGGMLTTSW